MSVPPLLHQLRAITGTPSGTVGLTDDIIADFAQRDQSLSVALKYATEEAKRLRIEFVQDFAASESQQIVALQKDFVNFYEDDSVNPYVALAAHGPWIITTKGAVLYDAGGYGMLGLGHSPSAVLMAMQRPHVMANIMTPNFSQHKLTRALREQIGFTRSANNRHPFAKFLCLNSGSESMSVAARIADINAAKLTAPGAKYAGRKIKLLALKGGFHGRTDRPAQASDSSMPKYKKFLASFRDRDNLVTVTPNHVEELKQAFAKAETDGVFFECLFIEPVMGEGNPGEAMTVEFYEVARELTKAHGTLLCCDSIQAGIRAQGCLSICDYPGFSHVEAPDMESYSKAINAGQYPLSVLAMNTATAALYVKGVYGNTMTTNPKALDVAVAVLSQITPELRKNVQERGKEFVEALRTLQNSFPQIIEDVKGTGLLVSAAIAPSFAPVVGVNGLEERMRRTGVNVIHGGKNSLRFTPHFAMTSAEVHLIINNLRALLSSQTQQKPSGRSA